MSAAENPSAKVDNDRRKLPGWVAWHEAYSELASKMAGDAMPAGDEYFSAARRIEQALREGQLRARTKAASFRLIRRTEDESRHVPLGDENVVPGEFWHLFEDASRIGGRLATPPTSYDCHPTWAATWGDTFAFRLQEDGVVIEGSADCIEVERRNVPGLGKRRGERGAVYQEQDLAAVERVIALIEGGMCRATAIKVEAAKLKGSAPSARLRKKLRDRGI